MLDGLNNAGLTIPDKAPKQWVADCRRVGHGEPALEYLSRYLYRGVIAERDIIANRDGKVTFRYVESGTGQIRTRTLPGADFLWLILQHVLPRGFRRVLDYGFLHGNASTRAGAVDPACHACLPGATEAVHARLPRLWQTHASRINHPRSPATRIDSRRHQTRGPPDMEDGVPLMKQPG